MTKVWNRIGRLNGSDAARLARPLWVCAACRTWHNDRPAGKLIKPLHCKFCGRSEFDYFHSEGEAQTWAKLHLRQRAGEIQNLRRQVPFALMTVGREGLACQWGEAVLDFTFDELRGGQWVPVRCDYKPAVGISPDAALKFRCLEAQGLPVRIITSNGEI